MKYILNQNIALRSFKLVPYAYYRKGFKYASGLKKEEFELLLKCDGKQDIPDSPLLKELCERRFCEPCDGDKELTQWQKHLLCSNRYFPAMYWMLTGKCNYNCLHCFNASDNNPITTEWSYEDAIKLLDEAQKCGINAITITGGEPLLHKNFLDILEAIYERGMYLDTLVTNGFFIDEAFLDRMFSIGCRPNLRISFDGIGYHDWMRGYEGAEEKAIQAIKLCTSRGLSVLANIQFNRKNKDAIYETLLLMEELGCYCSKVICTTPSTRWEQNQEGNTFALEELFEESLKLFQAYIAEKHRMSLNIWQLGTAVPTANGYQYSFADEGNEYRESLPLCKSNRGMISIGSNGEIYPCLQMSGFTEAHGMHWGNVKKDSLQEQLTNSKYLDEISATIKDLKEANQKCAECKYLTVCRGGCPALKLLYGGGFKASNPLLCQFFEGGYYDRIKELFQ